MRSTLDELSTELGELHHLLDSIDPVNSALRDSQDSRVQQYLRSRRRFDYAAFIVALYATFEKFIENLVVAYARIEATRVKYDDLPEKLKTKHLHRTGEMLSRGRFWEGRLANIEKVEAVKNLFNCLSGTENYTLNDMAISAHDANLRVGELDALFGAVGIDSMCNKALNGDAMLEWYRSGSAAPPSVHRVPKITVENRLRHIVERRNEVAHRGGNPDDLLGVDEMSKNLQFIGALSESIFSIVVGKYFVRHYTKSEQGIELKQKQNLKKGSVVVVEKPVQRLFIGQAVFVIKEPTARWGRIQEIQLDGVDVKEVRPDMKAENDVGLTLNFKCPRGRPLTALTNEDDLVWAPL